MESLSRLLAEHPVLKGLNDEHISFVSGCAMNVRFHEGEYLFREGAPVELVFLVRHGRVGVNVAVPGRGPQTLDVVGPGEMVGWSGLVKPYLARFDAQAMESVTALALDAHCLRNKCEEDPSLGYAMLTQVTDVLEERLQATRLQLLDLYASHR